jgi:hypothetical protein
VIERRANQGMNALIRYQILIAAVPCVAASSTMMFYGMSSLALEDCEAIMIIMEGQTKT